MDEREEDGGNGRCGLVCLICGLLFWSRWLARGEMKSRMFLFLSLGRLYIYTYIHMYSESFF